ncbi:MAG: GFA family protein [Hyphomicrobiaceae bacterium]|nr:GFA family protein [Hyphomicrobiaceae bacterium]
MSTPQPGSWSGGCQCGAVRFRAGSLGRPSLCHCRMCQKAFASVGGLLVTANDLAWTRGGPKYFQSSNKVRRGFCGDCGTPLTYEYPGGVEVAIVAFDRAGEIAPVIQHARAARLPWFDSLTGLPVRTPEEEARAAAFYAGIASRQHPDHDTEAWPAQEGVA